MLNLYHRAGVTEYWLVDAREVPPAMTIHRWTDAGYVTEPEDADGFRRSPLAERRFRLVRRVRPSGFVVFRLETRG